ncbi:MAG: SRPBCC domain-containing protein [Deltaproteobacteria bacterium]|nr:SRPBCC domain-containing protein [Deltaproteobacteria bacterium]
MLAREIKIETHIDAPVATVWAVLTDTAQWSSWNRILLGLEIDGTLEIGAHGRLQLELGPPLGVRTIGVKIDQCDPERELAWLGGLRAVAQGRHYFRMESDGSGTRFLHGERFSGIAVLPVWPLLEPQLTKSYTRFNRDFAERCASQS